MSKLACEHHLTFMQTRAKKAEKAIKKINEAYAVRIGKAVKHDRLGLIEAWRSV